MREIVDLSHLDTDADQMATVCNPGVPRRPNRQILPGRSCRPDTFDSSGLIQYCFGQAGISLPHGSANQAAVSGATEVDCTAAEPADLIFYDNPITMVGTFKNALEAYQVADSATTPGVRVYEEIFHDAFYAALIVQCNRLPYTDLARSTPTPSPPPPVTAGIEAETLFGASASQCIFDWIDSVFECCRPSTANSEPRRAMDSHLDFGHLIEQCWNPDLTKQLSIGEVWPILKSRRVRIIESANASGVTPSDIIVGESDLIESTGGRTWPPDCHVADSAAEESLPASW